MIQPVLGELFGIPWLYWYQPVLIILLAAVIAFYVIYRRKQM
jgi:cytochrome c-type biogenesis protein CcmH/NrfF